MAQSVLIGFCTITSFNENEIISTKILQVHHCQLKELLMNVKREDCILTQNVLESLRKAKKLFFKCISMWK